MDEKDFDPSYMTYWQARQAIIDALKEEDLERLELLIKLYPGLYKNMVGQAENGMKKAAK